MPYSLTNPPFSTLGRVRGNQEIAEWFEAVFWPLYPRRICKVTASAAANKRATSPDIRAEIIAGLRAQLPQMLARDREFIPYPSTWLNQERWKDEPDAAGSTSIPIASPRDQAHIERMRRMRSAL